MANIGEVYFRLYGDNFDPNEVSALVGIEPTETKLKGVPTPKYTSWVLSTGRIEDEVYDVYEKSKELAQILSPKRELIAQVMDSHNLKATFQVVLWITIDDSMPTPAIGFDEETVRFIASVGAYIDIDTYRKP